MNKDYKVELKPTYWDVILERGEYSDYEQEHLYFAGNVEEEIWIFLCRYLDSVSDKDRYGQFGAIQLCEDANKMFVTKELSERIKERGWDVRNSDIWSVTIKRLEVIYFKK